MNDQVKAYAVLIIAFILIMIAIFRDITGMIEAIRIGIFGA